MKTLSKFTIVFVAALSFSFSETLFAQYKSKYPDMPIVDVHIHVRSGSDAANYLKVSEIIKKQNGSNLAYFVGFFQSRDESLADVKAAGKNRFLFAVRDGREHRGFFDNSAEVIDKVQNGGYIGLKFWFGDPSRRLQPGVAGITRIDDPRFIPFFSKLEKANVLMTSLHIADPNGPFDARQNWMKDPVFYWEQIRAFENVVARHPNLTIVAAHCAWIICQDAQIDYLRYMLSTYPNLYLDVSATFPYMHLVNYDNLRDFYIEYQDRILFGSDFNTSGFPDDAIQRTVDLFVDHFAILETDLMVNRYNSKGLNLPGEVLEKIYYKNAVKLYPGMKELMGL